MKILGLLMLTVSGIFALESIFLVPEVRGETLTLYEKISWFDKILLLIDDFEGIKGDKTSLSNEKFFSYGSIELSTDSMLPDNSVIGSKTSMKITWNGKENYGGWGKG